MTDEPANHEAADRDVPLSSRPGDAVDGTRDLVALVAKPRAESTIAALRAEGLYDDARSAAAHDDDRVALPVTAPPAETAVEELVVGDLPDRARGLEDHLRERGWTDKAIARAPSSWAVVGSVVLVDLEGVPAPAEVGEALLDLHGEADTVLDRAGVHGAARRPDVTVVAGTGETETVHVEHGTRYALDLATVMFSPGNKAERARMGRVVEAGERVFDMFAGIGYFALPMARAGAAVTAAEINPTAYRYLVENAMLNGVEELVDAYRADCRDVEPTADRVVLGHYDAHEYLDVALDALSPGGVLHVHQATPEAALPDRPVERVVADGDDSRAIEVIDVRDVKGYSEGVRHVVVDARVR